MLATIIPLGQGRQLAWIAPRSLLWLEVPNGRTAMLCRPPNWFLRKNGFMAPGDTNAVGSEVRVQLIEMTSIETPEKKAKTVPPRRR